MGSDDIIQPGLNQHALVSGDCARVDLATEQIHTTLSGRPYTTTQYIYRDHHLLLHHKCGTHRTDRTTAGSFPRGCQKIVVKNSSRNSSINSRRNSHPVLCTVLDSGCVKGLIPKVYIQLCVLLLLLVLQHIRIVGFGKHRLLNGVLRRDA